MFLGIGLRLGMLGSVFSPSQIFANGEPGDAWIPEREFVYTKSAGGLYERVTTTGDEAARITGMVNGINADQDTVAKRPTYSEGSGLSWLAFDGVDDAMATGTITPGVDKAQVFAGVRRLSGAALGMPVEFSPSRDANTGAFDLRSNAGGSYSALARGSAGLNGDQNAATVVYAAPETSVLFSSHDISGDRTTLSRNNVSTSDAVGDKGAGNFLAYPLYIGARAGTSFYFTGNMYGLIVRFGPNLTDPQIASTEAYVATKTGVAL
jgi:hypothetical protein